MFVEGQLVYEQPKIQDIQLYTKEQLTLFWEEYKRLLNPEEYPVDLSQACWENKMKNIEEATERSKQIMEEI